MSTRCSLADIENRYQSIQCIRAKHVFHDPIAPDHEGIDVELPGVRVYPTVPADEAHRFLEKNATLGEEQGPLPAELTPILCVEFNEEVGIRGS